MGISSDLRLVGVKLADATAAGEDVFWIRLIKYLP
jgi:hypothetical protein